MSKLSKCLYVVFFLFCLAVFVSAGPSKTSEAPQDEAIVQKQVQSEVPYIKCGTAEAMKELYKMNPASEWEAKAFNEMSREFITQGFPEELQQPAAGATTYVIPTVFHVFGTSYSGITITDALIIDAMNKLNQDFQGLTADWNSVSAQFAPVKRALSIAFKLAQKDPSGNATTGITYHSTLSGFGNGSGYDSQIQQYAWDNYKYFNVYIMLDLYGDGAINNSGVCWYPDTWMSDNNLARCVYNGRYIGTNTTENFRRVLTHEFGHYLNLIHTFEGNCTSPNDNCSDTPMTTVNSGSCNTTTQKCSGAGIPNGENFMDYTECYRMFTIQQIARVQAALQHAARYPLWQTANLIATGLSDQTSAPTITTQPVNKSVTVGQTATFSVVASGTAPLSYKWYKRNVLISGATSANYTTPATITGDNGATFYVNVSNSYGSVNSNSVTLTVTSSGGGALSNGVAVTVSGATASQTQYYIDVPSGKTNLVIATSGGTGDLDLYTKFGSAPTTSSYDCRPYASGNNETCTVASPSTGRYYIMLYGYSAYSGASLKASFSTSSGVPAITTQPVSKSVTVGQTATFSVVASGTAPLSYQWYKNNATISGATAASYTTPATVSGDNGATFYVKVSNSAGNVNSNTVTLTVTSSGGAPTINLQITTASNTATCNPNTTNTVKVTYWVDSNAAVDVTISPFTYVINTSGMTVGSTHTVYGRAFNSAGLYIDSGWKSFVVIH